MKNPNELSHYYLGDKVWYKLTKEERAKYNQTIAPAFIVRGWINEYDQEENPEYKVGLNLRVILDHDTDLLHKYSVKRCQENLANTITLEDIPEGQYLCFTSLLHLDRSYEYRKNIEKREGSKGKI